MIKSSYGSDGGCSFLNRRGFGLSPCYGIIRMFIKFCDRCIDIQSLCSIRVGDEMYAYFW